LGWKVGVLTVSDRVFHGERDDRGGLLLCELVRRIDGEVAVYEIIPDEQPVIDDWGHGVCTSGCDAGSDESRD
jgi:molybdopterin adenylyltransferase